MITVMTLYCSPRGRTGKGRGREGSGLYPELAAYRVSEGCSPNVQSEVGRLVGLLPIEQARAELARKGQELARVYKLFCKNARNTRPCQGFWGLGTYDLIGEISPQIQGVK